MAVDGDARVTQAVELLRKAGLLDLLIRGSGEAGRLMRKESAGVAVVVQGGEVKDSGAPSTAPRTRGEEKAWPRMARPTPARDVNSAAARRPSMTSAAHRVREQGTASGQEHHFTHWQFV
ncbi:hypothetical protein NDU88_002670 [Pleurodeles waltl]|uniref:Uncharacterized protein n=1 Tax=Pleurodeles waltl TaxID=8319 RepID=A0AAV7L448_PLEWA|nr:hypothetical protein NDU88_002670 [Pleurodeles waltl]